MASTAAQQSHRHRGRDGPSSLVVQSFDDSLVRADAPGWTRMGRPSRRTPTLLIISYWIWSSTLVEGSQKRKYDVVSTLTALCKLVVAWPVIFILLHGSLFEFGSQIDTTTSYARITFGTESTSEVQTPAVDSISLGDDGLLIPTAYRDSDNIRLSDDLQRRPATQAPNSVEQSRRGGSSVDVSSRPRFLCFLVDGDETRYETRKVSDYIDEHGDHADIEFVFVSYTRLQFRVFTEEEIKSYDYPNEQVRQANRLVAEDDRKTLAKWGMDAARAAGKKAFWLDFECVRDVDGVARSTSKSEDVYRICDIVRAAHSMIIGVGPPVSSRIESFLLGLPPHTYGPESITEWLRQWGSRLWTLPELLLCPNEYRIKLYSFASPDEPKALAKRNFAERAWEDATAVKELVNHFEGSAILTQLQLIESALECFSRRQTDQFSPGDIAYAIMGLLPEKQRPTINHTDNGYTAFARLLLANDSGRFLERLLCVQPSRPDAPWYDIRDRWNAKIREISPDCQVTGIVGNGTILIDGVHGAIIEWDRLDPIALHSGYRYLETESFRASYPGWDGIVAGERRGWGTLIWTVFTIVIISAFTSKVLLWGLPFIQVVITVLNSRLRGPLPAVYSLFGLAGLTALFTAFVPSIVIFFRSGKLTASEARFIGLEGHADAKTVEKYLIGYYTGIFTEYTIVQHYHDNGEEIPPGTIRDDPVFTLIDTKKMTITHLQARKPPVAVLICGQHAGAQRALLCSYDEVKNAFVRETVLRMNNSVLERMARTDRVRFSLDRSPNEAISNGPGRTIDGELPEDMQSGSQLPAVDLLPHEPRDAKPDTPLSSTRDVDWALMPAMVLLFPDFYPLLAYASSDTYAVLSYWITFLVAQILAYFLLQRVQIQRVVLFSLLLRGIALGTEMCILDPWGYFGTLASVNGAASGFLAPSFVMLTLSWYRPNQVPLRMILWGVGYYTVVNIIYGALSWRGVRVMPQFLALLAIAIYFSVVTIGSSSALGLPKEVQWLSMLRQIDLAKFATVRSNLRETAAGASWKRQTVALLTGLSWYVLVFVFSVMNGGVLTDSVPVVGISSGLVSMTVIITIGLVLSWYPRLTAPAILISVALGLLGHLIMGVRPTTIPRLFAAAFALVESITKPLFWTFLGMSSSSWSEGLRGICVSLAGNALGKVLHALLNLQANWVTHLAIALGQSLALIPLVAYMKWKSTRRRAIALA